MSNDTTQADNKYFIYQDKFDLLKQFQQKVYDATEVSPSVRKLINALITTENLEKISNEIINALTLHY